MYPNNIESTKNYLHWNHWYLCSLTYYNTNIFMAEESMIEDWSFLDLAYKRWKCNVLSFETLNKLKEFRLQWVQYKRTNSHSFSPTFMVLDQRWKSIINEFLLPALDNLEEEMKILNIDFVPYKQNINPEARPTDEEIVKTAQHYLDILLKKREITINYIDE